MALACHLQRSCDVGTGIGSLRHAMDKVNAEIDNLIERSHLKQSKAA